MDTFFEFWTLQTTESEWRHENDSLLECQNANFIYEIFQVTIISQMNILKLEGHNLITHLTIQFNKILVTAEMPNE